MCSGFPVVPIVRAALFPFIEQSVLLLSGTPHHFYGVLALLYFPTVCFCVVSARVAIFPLTRGSHLVYNLRLVVKLSHTIKIFEFYVTAA